MLSTFSLRKVLRRPLAAIALNAVLAGCNTAQPNAYRALTSAGELASHPGDPNGHMPYRYARQVDWSRYRSAVLDPVVIYQGSDNQFGGMAEADKAKLAAFMTADFSEALSRRFVMTKRPGAGTVRVRLTLAGASKTVPIVATLSRFDMAGVVYNGAQAVRDRPGFLTGAVVYAVEIFDATTGELLLAYVAKQYPKAYDIKASMGDLTAAEVGIQRGAEELLKQVR